MSDTALPKPKNYTNIGLWVAQGVQAAFYGGVGFMKISQPIEQLAASMSWVNIFPQWMARFIGTAEIVGAAGLILPMLTGIMPRLTPLAALGLVVLQFCAMIFHISQGELNVLPVNILLLAISAFIFWGRWMKKV